MQTLTSLLLPCLLWATSLGAQGPGYLGVVLRATEAAVVAEVVEGSAAARVGLQPGDAMVAVDGEPTPTREAFVAAVQAHAAGQRLRVRVRRGDRERVVVVKLGERPSPSAAAPPGAPPERLPLVRTLFVEERAAAKGYLGVGAREVTGGLAVDRVVDGGPAARAGVQRGDVLTALGDRRLRRLADLDAALVALGAEREAALSLLRAGRVVSRQVVTGAAPERVLPDQRGGAAAPRAPALVEFVVETEETQGEPPTARAPARDVRAEVQKLRAELRELRDLLLQLRRGRE